MGAIDEDEMERNLLNERLLVHQWRFGLEGILIPCVGIPGVFGEHFVKIRILKFISVTSPPLKILHKQKTQIVLYIPI